MTTSFPLSSPPTLTEVNNIIIVFFSFVYFENPHLQKKKKKKKKIDILKLNPFLDKKKTHFVYDLAISAILHTSRISQINITLDLLWDLMRMLHSVKAGFSFFLFVICFDLFALFIFSL